MSHADRGARRSVSGARRPDSGAHRSRPPPPPNHQRSTDHWVTNLMSSTRSSTVHVPVPAAEVACHDSPTICVRVGIDEPEGLLNAEKGTVIVVGVAGGAAAIAYVGR